MTWRPWIILALAFVAVLVHAMLGFHEFDVFAKKLVAKTDEVAKIDEPLRHLLYKSTNRRNNFKEMGMDDEFAHAVATRIDRYSAMQAKFADMLQQQAAEVGDAFCPTEGLPQPYAASQYLVLEENGRRDVVDAGRLVRFDTSPWYAKAPVEQVYSELETVEDRKGDATLMGVAALLLGREAEVLQGTSPWSRSLVGSWGFKPLKRQDPKIEVMVVEYFSLMHYLTELANDDNGICR